MPLRTRRRSPSTSRFSRTSRDSPESKGCTRRSFDSPASPPEAIQLNAEQQSPISAVPEAQAKAPAEAPPLANSSHSSGHEIGMPGSSERDHDVIVVEEAKPLIEEPVQTVVPWIQLPDGHVRITVCDFQGRLSGGEGKPTIAQLSMQHSSETDSTQHLVAQLHGTSRRMRVGFDSFSHIVLPWPIPRHDSLDKLSTLRKNVPTQVIADMRCKLAPGFGQYASGQELVALVDGIWIDALVLQPPDEITSTVHKIQGGGSAHNLLLHPWNHAPQIMRCTRFNEVWNVHCTAQIATHSHITDALSGQQLNVQHQCVPLELGPADEDIGLGQVTDVGELYTWLVAAQALKREIPSTLGKAARFAAYGPPDEAADRVMNELSDRLLSVTGDEPEAKAGREVIQRAHTAANQIRDSYLSSSERLTNQQKADLDDHLAREKKQEEELASKQHLELEEYAKDKQAATTSLSQRHRDEAKALDRAHLELQTDQRNGAFDQKRQFEVESDKELKTLKDGQFKVADAFKRKIASTRVEGDARLATMTRKEQEEFQEQRSRQLKELEAVHKEEQSRIDDDFLREASETQQSLKERKVALDEAHAASMIALAEDQAAEIIATETAHAEAMKARLQDQSDAVVRLGERQKQDLIELKYNFENSRTQLQAAHVEERKQIATRHKDELKKFSIQAEARRTQLATKQDEERKALYAARRQAAASGETGKVRNPQFDDIPGNSSNQF